MWHEIWTEQQLAPIVQACRWLMLNHPLPPNLFKTFLHHKLARTHPDLAAHIATLHPSELEQLVGRIREQQCLSRSLVYG
jgi:hypothetical protein